MNEEMLVENTSEGSFVARRMVFNGVMNEGNISNVDVNRKMLKFQTMHIQNMLNN